ncbi:hypothetical protein LY76DRAFT_274454 [Colletotrichum caudatum]|nr:hypothetical protein LY76DRAFT_274454 [Colletotrichum caudatum]
MPLNFAQAQQPFAMSCLADQMILEPQTATSVTPHWRISPVSYSLQQYTVLSLFAAASQHFKASPSTVFPVIMFHLFGFNTIMSDLIYGVVYEGVPFEMKVHNLQRPTIVDETDVAVRITTSVRLTSATRLSGFMHASVTGWGP